MGASFEAFCTAEICFRLGGVVGEVLATKLDALFLHEPVRTLMMGIERMTSSTGVIWSQMWTQYRSM
jgi:hypothetical protein